MINEQKLTRDIIVRVKTVYWGKLLALPAFEFGVTAVLVVAAKQLVFWQAAVLNMAHLSVTGWLGYAAGAFWQTDLAVKFILVGVMVFAVKLFFDLVKSVSVYQRRMI